jgi:hypothetical protein
MTTGTVLGMTLVLVVVVEVLLLSLWVPWYCRRGIRVARKRVLMSGPAVSIASLETHCAAGVLSPRLAFRRLSEGEIAFQEAALPIALYSLASHPKVPGQRCLSRQALPLPSSSWVPRSGLGTMLS